MLCWRSTPNERKGDDDAPNTDDGRTVAAMNVLALEEYKLGHLTKPELRRLLGFGTRSKLDEFLKAHDVFEAYTIEDLERERCDLERLGF